jgi:hypothetical protein
MDNGTVNGTDNGTVNAAVVKHPAKFSKAIIEQINDILLRYTAVDGTLVDPFAGVGGVFDVVWPGHIVAIELESEWAMQAWDKSRNHPEHRDIVHIGDAFAVLPQLEKMAAVVTSPAYGNRMADSHTVGEGDLSKRMTYTHTLGRKLSAGNSGQLQWGDEYRDFHNRAWQMVHESLTTNGLFVLNVSDHIRTGKLQKVCLWHVVACLKVGFKLIDTRKVVTPRMGYGANGNKRVDGEMIYTFRKRK